MNNDNIVITGSVEGQEFIAEVSKQQKYIACYPKHVFTSMNNANTQERAEYIFKQLLVKHATLVDFSEWSYFELQTGNAYVVVTTVFGLNILRSFELKIHDDTLKLDYEVATNRERKRIEPIVKRLETLIKESNKHF